MFRFSGSGIPYFKVEQLSNAEKYLGVASTPYLFEHGDTVPGQSVIFAKRGGAIALNRIRILQQASFMDTNLMALTPVEGLDCEYFYYALGHIGLWRFADTTSVPQINNKHIKPLAFPLPLLAEQRAIAEALRDVDGLLGGLDRLIAKKRDLKQAAMQQLLTGQTRLPGCIGEWETLLAREVGTFKGGNGFPLSAQGETAGEYPYFKVSDMNNAGNETFMTTANHYVSEETRKRIGATPFPADSIVFAKVGAAVFLERKKILGQASCIDNNMAAFEIDTNRADVGYVHALLLSKRLGALVATTALPALNASQLGAMQLALPPLDEQRAIAAIVCDMDAELIAVEARREKTRALKQAMMQELLTGRTRLVKPEIAAHA